MAKSKETKSAGGEGEGGGDKGIKTRLVLMAKPKPDEVEGERPQEANVEWVFKQMVPKRKSRTKAPPSIGSMPIPGKP